MSAYMSVCVYVRLGVCLVFVCFRAGCCNSFVTSASMVLMFGTGDGTPIDVDCVFMGARWDQREQVVLYPGSACSVTFYWI